MRSSVLRAVLLAIALQPAFLASGWAQSDGATLALRVLAHETGQPIAGAKVAIPSQGLASVTGAGGWARIAGIPPGSYVVEVSHLGYAPERFAIDFEAGQTVGKRLELLARPIALDTVEARSERLNSRLASNGFYDRQRLNHGRFLTREDIAARASRQSAMSVVLRGLPGVHLQPSRAGRGYIMATARGRCASQVYLDGVLVVADQSSSFDPKHRQVSRTIEGTNIDNLIDSTQLEAIEWYSGPAQTPPQFNRTGGNGSSPTCGTLVLWTRAGN